MRLLFPQIRYTKEIKKIAVKILIIRNVAFVCGSLCREYMM